MTWPACASSDPCRDHDEVAPRDRFHPKPSFRHLSSRICGKCTESNGGCAGYCWRKKLEAVQSGKIKTRSSVMSMVKQRNECRTAQQEYSCWILPLPRWKVRSQWAELFQWSPKIEVKKCLTEEGFFSWANSITNPFKSEFV